MGFCFCPRCGGVWLDGGELNKLIARIREYEAEEAGGWEPEEYEPSRARRGLKRRKRGIFGFLEDLFEFD